MWYDKRLYEIGDALRLWTMEDRLCVIVGGGVMVKSDRSGAGSDEVGTLNYDRVRWERDRQ